MSQQAECDLHGLTEFTEPNANGTSFCKQCMERYLQPLSVRGMAAGVPLCRQKLNQPRSILATILGELAAEEAPPITPEDIQAGAGAIKNASPDTLPLLLPAKDD